MLMFLCLCSSWALFVAPVVTLESETNSKCTENGDCLDQKFKSNPANGNNSNNDSNAAPFTYYEVTDDSGNKFNISVVDIKTLLSSLTEKHDNYDKIQRDVTFVFQGVIVAVILFGVCATICVVSACIYCCRINIMQHITRSMTGCTEDGMDQCWLFERFTPLTLVLLIVTIVILAFICCICMKISDLKLRACVTRMARRKGVKLDLDKLNLKHTPTSNSPGSHLNENCTIMVPDVAIVL